MAWVNVSPRTAQQWGAVAPQWLGVTGLIACFVVWLVTQRVEPTFLTAFGGLLAVGQGVEAIVVLRASPPIPPPVPDRTVEEHLQRQAEDRRKT